MDAEASVMVRAHVPQLPSYSISPGSGSVTFKNACVKYDLPGLIYPQSATLCPHVHYDHYKPHVVVGHCLHAKL